MATQYSLISQLRTGTTSWLLKARLTRKWNLYSFNRTPSLSSEPIGVEMLLIDEEGTQIVASVNVRWVSRFGHILAEGKLYTFRTFTVRHAHSNYRVADNDLTMAFMQSTVVDIVPFQHLRERIGVTSKLTGSWTSLLSHLCVDLVGRLISCAEIELVCGGVMMRRLIQLEDVADYKREVALFGDACEMLYDSDVDTTPILVVTSVIVRPWDGFMAIFSTAATRIFKDIDIPEVQAFNVAPGPDAAAPPSPVVD